METDSVLMPAHGATSIGLASVVRRYLLSYSDYNLKRGYVKSPGHLLLLPKSVANALH